MNLASIHSLNGRENSLLPWLWDSAGGDPAAFRDDMQQTVGQLSAMLATRNIDYAKLKSALVPNDKRFQVALLYDWLEHPPRNYAVAFADCWLPVLRKDIRTSFLSGDLLREGRPSDSYLDGVVHRADNVPIRWDTQFAVFFSNLNATDIDSLHGALKANPRYRGYLDLTHAGPVRNYLARTLTFPHVVFGRKIVTAHDDDFLVVGRKDPVGYSFVRHGFDVTTVNASFVLALMHYKIEADNSPDQLNDLKYSLAAIAGDALLDGDIEVIVDPEKVEKYLLKDESKSKLMKGIGLESVSATELAAVISDRVKKNYIYDLRPASDGITPSFAVSGEFRKPDGSHTRRLIALKFDVEERRIALVSMY